MICTRQEFIIVNEFGCPDWSQLPWQVPTVGVVSPGQTGYTVTPIPPANSASVRTTGFNDAVDLISLQYVPIAHLTYDGPGCNCNLKIVLGMTYPADPATIGLTVQVDNFTALTHFVIQSYDGDGSGTYNLPFVLTPGAYTIQVRIQWGLSGPGDPGAATIDLAVTLT